MKGGCWVLEVLKVVAATLRCRIALPFVSMSHAFGSSRFARLSRAAMRSYFCVWSSRLY